MELFLIESDPGAYSRLVHRLLELRLFALYTTVYLLCYQYAIV